MRERLFWRQVCQTLTLLVALHSPLCAALEKESTLPIFLLSEIRYNHHRRADDISDVDRELIATHDARSHFGTNRNVVERVIFQLPTVGDKVFKKTSYQLIGPESEGDDGIFKAWSGRIEEDSGIFSGQGSFVLSPSGVLFCDIKIGNQKYKCSRCQSTSDSETLPSESCVRVTKLAPLTKDAAPRSFTKVLDPFSGIKEDRALKSAGNKLSLENISDLNSLFGFDSTRNVDLSRNLVDDGTVIDLLFGYTAAVIDFFGSEVEVQAAITTAISTLNVIYSNTGIELEAKVTAWGLVDYIETDDYKPGLEYLETDDIVNDARDLYGADLVTLLTMDDIGSYTYTTNPASADTAKYGYSVIGAMYIVDYYTIPLAYGRNFGCDNNYADSSQDRVIPYAYGYQSVNCDFHTIMSASCDNSEAIAYYSSPLYSWIATGELLGDAESADCSRVIADTKLIISQYRDSVILTTSPTAAPASTLAPTTSIIPTSMPTSTVEPTHMPSPAPTPEPTPEPTPAPTPILTTEPTPMATTRPTPAPTPAPTIAPTLKPTPAPTLKPTPAPIAVPSPSDGIFYTSKYLSVLSDQDSWYDSVMNDFFASVVQEYAQTILNAGLCNVVVDDYQSNRNRRHRSLQSSSSVDIFYTISNVSGIEATINVANFLNDSSTNGDIAKSLNSKSALFTVSGITTKLTENPKVQDSDSSDGSIFPLIAVILLSIFIPCILAVLMFLTFYCWKERRKDRQHQIETREAPQNQAPSHEEVSRISDTISNIHPNQGIQPQVVPQTQPPRIQAPSSNVYSNQGINSVEAPQNVTNAFLYQEPIYAVLSPNETLVNKITKGQKSYPFGKKVQKGFEEIEGTTFGKNIDWLDELERVIPSASFAYGLLLEIETTISNKAESASNFTKVIGWVQHSLALLKALGEHLCQFPDSKVKIDFGQVEALKRSIEKIHCNVYAFQKNNLLLEFASSKKLQTGILEASNSLHIALLRLNLRSNDVSFKTDLMIDEATTLLISSMEDQSVDIVAMASMLKNSSRTRSNKKCIDTISSISLWASNGGDGPIMTEMLLKRVPDALRNAQIDPAGVTKNSMKPLRTDGFARTFSVTFREKMRILKVVDISNVSFEKKQDIFVKMIWELYVLSTLKSPQVITFIGYYASITSFALVYENPELGSLRSVLDQSERWKSLSSMNRHMILSDVAEGMTFLHKNELFHRNLNSHCIMLSKDFRAKISEFGMRITLSAISDCSGNAHNKPNNKNIAWSAPELFGERKTGYARAESKYDVYSYGIITFEVLSGFAGSNSSTPWLNLSEAEIKNLVIAEKRPSLPDSWDEDCNVLHSKDHYDIMIACLENLPSHRPSFSEINAQMENKNFAMSI